MDERILLVRFLEGEEDMTEETKRTRNVWYITDDYGTLVRFVETESGVRFWWDAIHETAVAKILGYTQWKSKYD